MATCPAGRYDPTMKTWPMTKWLYALAVTTASASLLIQIWLAYSGGVIQWGPVVLLITIITACTFGFVRASKPHA
jgi:hypothetical protein